MTGEYIFNTQLHNIIIVNLIFVIINQSLIANYFRNIFINNCQSIFLSFNFNGTNQHTKCNQFILSRKKK